MSDVTIPRTMCFLLSLIGDDVYKSLPRFVPTRIHSGSYRTFDPRDMGNHRVAICESDSAGELSKPFLAIQYASTTTSSRNKLLEYDGHADEINWEIGGDCPCVYVYLFHETRNAVVTCRGGSTRYEGPFTVMSSPVPPSPTSHHYFQPLQNFLSYHRKRRSRRKLMWWLMSPRALSKEHNQVNLLRKLFLLQNNVCSVVLEYV